MRSHPIEEIHAYELAQEKRQGQQLSNYLKMLKKSELEVERKEIVLFETLAYAKKMGLPCGIRKGEDTTWLIAFIALPIGEVSWHIQAVEREYEFYTTKEKFKRIDDYCEIYES